MSKTRLDIDALQVETFEVAGGVVGHDSGEPFLPSAESGCGPCPTKELTCPVTCQPSCADDSCWSDCATGCQRRCTA